MAARYESVGEFFRIHSVDSVRDQLIGRDLVAVEEYVERRLAGGPS